LAHNQTQDSPKQLEVGKKNLDVVDKAKEGGMQACNSFVIL
jgi:hypothetical protein